MSRPRVAIAVLVAFCAASAVLTLRSGRVRIRPGRLTSGLESGRLNRSALVLLPGLDRRGPRTLYIVAEGPGGGPVSLGVAVDGGPPQWVTARRGSPAVVALPPRGAAGARVSLTRGDGPAPHVLGLEVEASTRRPWAWMALAAAGAALAAWTCAAAGPSASFARSAGLGAWAGGLLALGATPAVLLLSASWPRMVPAVLLALAGAALSWRVGAARRAVLVAAFAFGLWVRLAFLPTPGSWDTEYWKAWTERAATAGVTQVYGGPDAVAPGHLLAQLQGREPLWLVQRGGREYVIDYPPLAILLWRSALAAAGRMDLGPGEARNVAAKLPSVAGDLLAVAVLLWVLRDQPRSRWTLAAVFWASPASWLPTAVLGFIDGALAPLLVVCLAAAARGRGGIAGALLAVAALVKPTALVVAPAAAVALRRPASILRAAASGAVVTGVVLLPFALAGTLSTAVVHCYRILFQNTLSGGYPNLWWLLGHAVAVMRGSWPASGPVGYVTLDAVPFAARPLGALLVLAAALFVAWRQRRATGASAALLCGAILVLAYGMLAIGVHENHPHAALLLLAATGLPTARLRWIFAGLSAVYAANMLMMSGLGRLGALHDLLDPVARTIAGARMAAGFDLTLALSAGNVALVATLFVGLRRDLDALQGPPREPGRAC